MEIRNGDVTLHVREDGDPGGTPVLLLHGITGSTATYDWFVPQLASYRVLRLDFRGHGRSGRAPGQYQFGDYVSDAVATCEQAVGAPCVIVGHSLGGGTAAALAQQRPDLARGVVLEDPAVMGAADVDALEGNALSDVFVMMRTMVPELQAAGLSAGDLAAQLAFMPSASGGTFGELVHPDALTATAEALLQLDASVLDPVIERSTVPVFDPLAPIPVPGVVLAADPSKPDAVVRERDAARLREHSPLVDVRVLPGAGHLIHDQLDQREHYVAAVLGFLAEHAG